MLVFSFDSHSYSSIPMPSLDDVSSLSHFIISISLFVSG